ncbi:RdgB/HAM1 family non-canonical purine NTP pyrophosphatase [candidate division CSSED10-310 bacterium]|uniref:dITP/XTP pyrophosphatase n=1 Tax=candidate division CSSED10-310 bacterium TaxID=2855610 RepID=A0ABV6YZR6_UNCC1
MFRNNSIIIASRNPGKIREISIMFAQISLETKSLLDFDLIPPEETAATYHENSYQKALWTYRHTDTPCLADDSGLEIESLGDKPGVLSARYFGDQASDKYKNEQILKALNGHGESERKARFVCLMVLVLNENVWLSTKGVIPGSIAQKPAGSNGFGYDPIFIPQGHQQTFALIPVPEKNRISHRGQALSHMFALMRAILGS